MPAKTVPAAYARFIETAIAVALREARRDAAVRAGQTAPEGYRPLPDSFVDPKATGDLVIAVLHIESDEQQLRDEEWPNEPAPGELRFPGYPKQDCQLTTTRKRA